MSRNMVSILILILASTLLSAGCGAGNQDPFKHLSLKQAQQDFVQLRTLIDNNHPMFFTDRAGMKQTFDTQFDSLSDNLTVLELYHIIAPAVASVRCGHTRLSLPDDMAHHLLDSAGTLPFEVRVIGDSLYVLKDDAMDTRLAPGSQILSINGRSASEIIERMTRSLPADGTNQTYKWFQMNTDFDLLYREFVDDGNAFVVEYIAPDADSTATCTIAARPADTETFDPTDLPLIEESIVDEISYAVKRIWFFGYFDDPEKFDSRMHDFFDSLSAHNIGTLILDLRQNDGGDPYTAATLLRYLLPHSFRYFGPGSTFLNDDLKELQSVSDNRFDGALYVLVDGGCYSTTGHFCALLKTNREATFIGTETGGSYACNGGFKEHTLSHSGVQLLLPYTTFIAAAGGLEFGRGIQPDYKIEPTVSDLVSGHDPAMELALSLLTKRTLHSK